MIYTSRKKTSLQEKFGGLCHTDRAGAEDLFDLQNLTSDRFPLIAARPRRWKIYDGDGITALTAVGDVIYFVQNGKLCKSSAVEKTEYNYSLVYMAAVEELADVNGVANAICVMGNRLILSPVMVVYHIDTGELLPMGTSFTGAVNVTDGLLYEEVAVSNRMTLSLPWEELGFRVGDGITYVLTSDDGTDSLSGSSVIRSIDGVHADFSENCFAEHTGGFVGTISRTVPDMDYLLVCQNRLFGCKADTIYASKLGDPFNFNVFDGISTDSWFVESGSGGEFTGCCEYLGYPFFFKTDAIYKLYGSQPDSYRLTKTDAYGVKEGANESLAVVGEMLFYHSPAGICAYTGGYPSVILTPGEMDGYAAPGGFAAGDGRKYYLRLIMRVGNPILLVFDTQTKLWHKEDGTVIPCICSDYPGNGQRNLLGIASDGLYIMGTPAFTLSQSDGSLQQIGHPENPVVSFAEFGSASHGSMGSKVLWGLTIRLEVEKEARLTLSVAYDNGRFQEVFRQRYIQKGTVSIPIRPMRCDSYRLRIAGEGEYRILAIARTYSETAKPNHKLY